MRPCRTRILPWLAATLARCLALGLITSIAVAWQASIAIGMGSRSTSERIGGAIPPHPAQPRPVTVIATEYPRATHSLCAISKVFELDTFDQLHWQPPHVIRSWELTAIRSHLTHDTSRHVDRSARFIAAGWPMLSVWADISRYRRMRMPDEPTGIRGGWLIRDVKPLAPNDWPALDPPGILPYYPIWPGLLANTAAFAALWLIPFTLIPLLRRSLRFRQGLCPSCGYERQGLADDAPCPECGSPPRIQPRIQATRAS